MLHYQESFPVPTKLPVYSYWYHVLRSVIDPVAHSRFERRIVATADNPKKQHLPQQ